MARLIKGMFHPSKMQFQSSPLKVRSGARFSSSQSGKSSVRIACASGFWGDTPTAVPQLVYGAQNLDFLVFDYLSEVTMSLLTAAQQKNPELGFAPDFVMHALGPYLNDIKNKGIRVISNAGGINTNSCVAALKMACAKAGVDLKIAQVSGDNLFPIRNQLLANDPVQVQEMGTGRPLPKTVHSITAYYGAGPIVRALDMGADIVVTGRTADSALALAPCIHQLKWDMSDFDKMSAGSLAGHLIECGGQATGGLFTDWEKVQGYENLGFPIIEVHSSGEMLLSKPPNTGGLVSEATVSEQLLYEIGNPQRYILPDVVCDFSHVKIKQEGADVVRVSGAVGSKPTDTFKVCSTYLDGYKATAVSIVAGGRAAAKARKTADAILNRSRGIFKKLGLKDFERTHVTVIGHEENYSSHFRQIDEGPRDVALWMSVHHSDKKALEIWAREIASSGTGMTPGLCGMVGGRPKPSPCLKLFSFLYPKTRLPALVTLDDQTVTYEAEIFDQIEEPKEPAHVHYEPPLPVKTGLFHFTLEDLAYARSGDKGDSCNIGIIARHPTFLPYIKHHLTEEKVADFFAHYLEKDKGKVRRFDVPGIHAVNFLLEHSLGGGGIASLRPDPLGKSYAQMLLSFPLDKMPCLEDIKDSHFH